MKPQPRASLLAARILGPLLLPVGALLITDYARMLSAAHAFFENEGVVALGAMVSLIVGLTLMVLHPYWRGLTKALISLMGVLATVRGLLLLFTPDTARELIGLAIANPHLLPVVGCVLALVGLWLIVYSFIAPPEDGLGYFN